MIYAVKTLAATSVDLLQRPRLRQANRSEFDRRRAGRIHRSYLPDGPPPVPEE